MEKIIGKRIQEYRKKKGLTQDRLSEMIGLSPHYLSALERGIYNIKLDLLVKILNCLDCSADEIFCDVVNKSSIVKSNKLSERINELSPAEQNRIYDVVETMVNSATK